ncbi:Poly(A) RNA polymerase gld-2 A-like [Homarus americanus]|uniref:Poly(A) RNA polymerase gld-2 A-like n=1 Tax=Homarus americanus TaxID=6706 RepID=A0A8J5KFY8_HOMAM|nr:Poly(A) RNA polymerase gld-2 A-like [Homarus americanus]
MDGIHSPGGGESTSSGGSDTGYSSRCSTPPGPSSLTDPKQGTKRHLDVPGRRSTSSSNRESRSGSPSSCSVTSQGSYRNPRQKRRYNNNSDGHNIHQNNYTHHHPHHQVHHHPHHLFNVSYNHHHHNQHGGYMGNTGNFARGNNYYYSHHCPDVAQRDCTNYPGQRYEKGYNNYSYYRQFDHPRRDFNQQGFDDGRYGRYNQGRGYNNRYNTNQFNNQYAPHGSGNNRDQSRRLNDRAGTFSDEKVNVNAKWKCEVVETPKELLTGSEWDGLSQQVWDTFSQSQQTNETFFKKLKLREKISRVIRNVLPNCRLHVVGSSLSGFGADYSDVDMCLMVTPGDLDQRTEATAVLRLLQRELNNCGSIQKMELIRAKVPILKFRDAYSKIDVDLNCNNAVGIRNTHLLNSYSQLDWRVRPLVLVVKLWAQYHNINNAKDMTISSYSLVLMVIHYLQHGMEPPVLPCLQKTFPEKFRAATPITSIPVTEKMPTFTSNNHDSLGKLFHGFLDYFANRFTFIEETISVRTGGIAPTDQCRNVQSRKNDSRMWKYLCIEEPFDLTNTARSVYDEAVFERVKKVFVDSYKQLNEKRDLSYILS